MLEAGQPEVDHLDGAIAAVHHVFRLQIAVNDAVLVRCRQRPGDLAGDGQDLADGQAPPPQGLAQRMPGHVFADEVQVAVELLQREDRCNAGVRQRCGGHRLAPQPRAEPVVVHEGRRQRLDRHGPVETRIAPEVDDAHAAAAEQAGNLIGTEPAPNHDGSVVARRQAGIDCGGGLLQRARLRVRLEERLDVLTERAVARALRVEERFPRIRLPRERGVEQLVNPLPILRLHRRRPG